MTWLKGQQLQRGRYTIERELGRGRISITYLAKDQNGNNLVIKTLNENLLNQLSPSDRSRLESDFIGEVPKLQKFHHPHIVRVYDLFKEGQQYGIAMEYIAGVTLANRAERILPEKEALVYILQIGSALTEVHRQNYLHRDVKPEKIILRAGKKEAVLINFILAREFDHSLTSRALITDGFTPIEMYSQKLKRGAWTDIYSLAATLYILLTGVAPPSALDRKDGTKQLVPPKQLNPKISERVNRAILEAMKLEPESRPQTMKKWLKLCDKKPVIPIWVILVGIGIILALATGILYNLIGNPETFWAAIGAIATLLGSIFAAIAYFKPPSN